MSIRPCALKFYSIDHTWIILDLKHLQLFLGLFPTGLPLSLSLQAIASHIGKLLAVPGAVIIELLVGLFIFDCFEGPEKGYIRSRHDAFCWYLIPSINHAYKCYYLIIKLLS